MEHRLTADLSNPLPGTFRIIESSGGRVVRLAWTCPDCRETFYDFFADGKQLPESGRFQAACLECLRRAQQTNASAEPVEHSLANAAGLMFDWP